MKILVVEDSMLYRKAIVKYLSEELPEAEFIVGNDGAQGYQLYKSERPDLILIDLLMPKMSGDELLRKIREEDQKTEAVVITADIQDMVKAELEELGIMAFVNKPFNKTKAAKLAKLIKKEF